MLCLTDTQLPMLTDAVRPLPLHKRVQFMALVEQALKTRDCDVQAAVERATLAVLDPMPTNS